MHIRIQHFGIVPLLTALLWAATPTQAALISNFTDLRTELSDRVDVLSNSVDKAELKQAKACTKGIATIDKSLTLAGDIKAGSKVAKSLLKAFPNEFNVLTLTAVTFSNNVFALLGDGYDSMGAQVQDILDALQTSINALPSGTDKTSAQAALDLAQTALENALLAGDFSAASKLLSAALKSSAKAQTIVDKADSGGGGGDSMTATVKIGSDAPFQWAADAFNPLFIQTPGNFQINGVRGTDSEMTIVFTGFTPAVGTYSLGAGNGDYVVFTPLAIYNVTSGTLNLTTVDLGNTTIAGTFSFTATNETTTVTVTNGAFNLTNLLLFP